MTVSKFTKATGFMATPLTTKEPWRTTLSFKWVIDMADPEGDRVVVPQGFDFDGASVPWPLTAIFPRVHRTYMQSAALHDWCLKHERHRFSRNDIDLMFKSALIAQRNKPWRVMGLYWGVKLFGIIVERRGYFKPKT